MSNTSYSHSAKFMHWLIAGLILTQYIIAKLAEIAEDGDSKLEQLALLANHKSIGITILVLAVIRLIVRYRIPPPPALPTMPVWQQTASKMTHWLLYGCLFALPITGWLMSSAKAYSVSWFSLFTLPDLVSPNERLATFFVDAHEFLGEVLIVLAAVHVLAALKHHFIDKDSVLTRMARRGSWALFIATTVIALLVFGRAPTVSEEPVNQAPQSTSTVEATASELPLWEIDYNDSFIKFSGDQAGAEFSGQWQKWQADIQFDAAQLEQARFKVIIEPQSVSTNDKERDQYIRSEAFFHVDEFSQASFTASEFTAVDGSFQTSGQLKMKGITHTAILTFDVKTENGRKILTGTAPLDRLLWNIGTGEWRDTSWVGQQVMVEVRVAQQASK